MTEHCPDCHDEGVIGEYVVDMDLKHLCCCWWPHDGHPYVKDGHKRPDGFKNERERTLAISKMERRTNNMVRKLDLGIEIHESEYGMIHMDPAGDSKKDRKFTEKDFYRFLFQVYYCNRWPWRKRLKFELLWLIGIKGRGH